MTVIPIHRQRTPGQRRPTDRSSLWEASIRGSFRSPTGRTGTMTGSLRVERFIRAIDRVWAECVFSGTLLDADGSHIGTGSRRQRAPALIQEGCDGSPATIGPVEVDLLGLCITVPALTVVSTAGEARREEVEGDRRLRRRVVEMKERS